MYANHEIGERVFVGTGAVMPLAAALKEIQDTPYWQSENLRIHQDVLDYFFSTEI